MHRDCVFLRQREGSIQDILLSISTPYQLERYQRRLARKMLTILGQVSAVDGTLPSSPFVNLLRKIRREWGPKWPEYNWREGIPEDVFT